MAMWPDEVDALALEVHGVAHDSLDAEQQVEVELRYVKVLCETSRGHVDVGKLAIEMFDDYYEDLPPEQRAAVLRRYRSQLEQMSRRWRRG